MMKRIIQISPSILSANYAHLGADIRAMERAGANRFHLDIMDGHFVPNLSIGLGVVRGIRPITSLPFDVHLMVEKPSQFIEEAALSGADTITVHVETKEDILFLISLIKRYKKKVGLALSPETSVSKIMPYIPLIDVVLVMAVPPGKGGQTFIPETLKKIAALKSLIGRKKVLVAVDGGIQPEIAESCRLVGADILISGHFLFKARQKSRAIQQLKGELCQK